MNGTLYTQNNIPKPVPVRVWRKPTLKEVVLVFALILAAVLIALNWGHIYQNIKYVFSKPDKEEIYYQQVARIYRDSEVTLPLTSPTENQNPNTANIYSAVSGGSSNAVITGDYIEIPKLKVYAPIVETGNGSAESVLAGLKHGVVRYADSGTPKSGQTIILGHSSSRVPYKYGSIFALLGKLEPNDVIHIKYRGELYSYFVTVKQTGSVDELKLKNFEGDLVLTSCWPPGTDTGRITISAVKAPIDNN